MISKKNHGLLSKDVLLLTDNSLTHQAEETFTFLCKYDYGILPYFSYSPDLAFQTSSVSKYVKIFREMRRYQVLWGAGLPPNLLTSTKMGLNNCFIVLRSMWP